MRHSLVLILTLLSLTITATDTQQIFAEANKAYTEGDYQTAESLYKQLLDNADVSKELYYNIGNAYFKQDKLGLAILNYERALIMAPRDNKIITNLTKAKDRMESSFIEVKDFFLLRYWNGIAQTLSPVIWMLLQFLSGLVFLFGLYRWKLSSQTNGKFKGFILAISSLFLMFLFYCFGNSANNLIYNQDKAIVLLETTMLSGPDPRANEVEALTEGVKLTILDQSDSWYKVHLVNKEEGWVSMDKVERI